MEEKKNEQTRQQIIQRWEKAKERKRQHVAKLEQDLNDELVKSGQVKVKLEAW